MKIQADYKKDGRWVQRSWIGDKYTWTVSGVLWNNIKERCKINGVTQKRSPTYKGAVNLFEGFQQFTEWNKKQIGYNMGYQLDADILKKGNKVYSPSTCVLIPPSLNKFLETSQGRRGNWPQGIWESNGKLICEITVFGENKHLGSFNLEDVDLAREIYKKAKDTAGKLWYDRLKTDPTIDPRVVNYMEKWEHICDWKQHE